MFQNLQYLKSLTTNLAITTKNEKDKHTQSTKYRVIQYPWGVKKIFGSD
jgi:septin family protein